MGQGQDSASPAGKLLKLAIAQMVPGRIPSKGLVACVSLKGCLAMITGDLQPDFFPIDSQALQHISGYTFTFTEQTQKKVFGSYMVMAKAMGPVHGQLNDPLGSGSKANLAGGFCSIGVVLASWSYLP